jgi:hypothetical protein
LIVSFPAPPLMAFALADPVNMSLKAEPIRFSKMDKVSEPAPPVFWALVVARLTVTAAVACMWRIACDPQQDWLKRRSALTA